MAFGGYDDMDPRRQPVPAPPMAPVPNPPMMGMAPQSDTTNRAPAPKDDAATPPPPVPEPPPVMPMSPMSEVATGIGAGSYGLAPAAAPSGPMTAGYSGGMSAGMSPFNSMGLMGAPPRRLEDEDMLKRIAAALGQGGPANG